jgi:stage V sporulation protein AF
LSDPLDRRLSRHLQENLDILGGELGVGESFDVLLRRFRIAGRPAALLFLDGFAKDLVMRGVMEFLLKTERRQVVPNVIEDLLTERLTFIEAETVDRLRDVVNQVLAGPLALLIDGEREAIIIDAREYPGRSPEEPDLERVLRGSRDGFVETIVFNTALIRRRVRDPAFRAEIVNVGRRSRTDVALVHLKDVANPQLVAEVRRRVQQIVVDGIPMAEKTLEEFIVGKVHWWNPFPVVRYTERPDVAAVHLLEGHVVVVVDSSPSAMILPATLFHHVQHAEEFRENVTVGAYLRWVRFLAMLWAWVGAPLWLLVATRPELLPAALRFIGPRQPGRIPLGFQFILAELAVDAIRIALIHTPNALATSLGFIGALLLGEMAVGVGLFAAETVIYVALAAIGTFATPSMEFGLALRLVRLLLLVLVTVAGPVGLLLGLGVNLTVLALTRSFGIPYLWPLVPLDWSALRAVLLRLPIPLQRARFGVLAPQDRSRR